MVETAFRYHRRIAPVGNEPRVVVDYAYPKPGAALAHSPLPPPQIQLLREEL